ncbi:MAG: hypothetical protein ACP5RP_00415, partial [Candidatus Micrarchaeia archaeon]
FKTTTAKIETDNNKQVSYIRKENEEIKKEERKEKNKIISILEKPFMLTAKVLKEYKGEFKKILAEVGIGAIILSSGAFTGMAAQNTNLYYTQQPVAEKTIDYNSSDTNNRNIVSLQGIIPVPAPGNNPTQPTIQIGTSLSKVYEQAAGILFGNNMNPNQPYYLGNTIGAEFQIDNSSYSQYGLGTAGLIYAFTNNGYKIVVGNVYNMPAIMPNGYTFSYYPGDLLMVKVLNPQGQSIFNQPYLLFNYQGKVNNGDMIEIMLSLNQKGKLYINANDTSTNAQANLVINLQTGDFFQQLINNLVGPWAFVSSYNNAYSGIFEESYHGAINPYTNSTNPVKIKVIMPNALTDIYPTFFGKIWQGYTIYVQNQEVTQQSWYQSITNNPNQILNPNYNGYQLIATSNGVAAAYNGEPLSIDFGKNTMIIGGQIYSISFNSQINTFNGSSFNFNITSNSAAADIGIIIGLGLIVLWMLENK